MGIPVARMELLDEVQLGACIAYSKLENLEARPSIFFEFHGTEADVAEQRKAWDHYDKRLEALGFKRPTRPRGRPKTEPPPPRVIKLDGGEIGWLPNFHKPGTPEHAEYEEAMRRAGKKPGDPS